MFRYFNTSYYYARGAIKYIARYNIYIYMRLYTSYSSVKISRSTAECLISSTGLRRKVTLTRFRNISNGRGAVVAGDRTTSRYVRHIYDSQAKGRNEMTDIYICVYACMYYGIKRGMTVRSGETNYGR